MSGRKAKPKASGKAKPKVEVVGDPTQRPSDPQESQNKSADAPRTRNGAPLCTVTKRNGELCGAVAIKGRKACRVHGGKLTGAPKGNQNAKRQGLFARCFGDDAGAEVYEKAMAQDGQTTAKESAALLVAKVAEAYAIEHEPKGAARIVAEALSAAVDAEEISQDSADRIMRLLRSPDPTALARALAPLKNLLDAAAIDPTTQVGTLREAILKAEERRRSAASTEFED